MTGLTRLLEDFLGCGQIHFLHNHPCFRWLSAAGLDRNAFCPSRRTEKDHH
jgi:hypothetical protein